MRRWIAGLAVAGVLAGACSGDSDDSEAERRDLLTPDFAPDPGAVNGPTPSSAGGGTGTSQGPGGEPSAFPETRGSLVDPAGDATPAVADSAPPWADLVGGTLTRRSDGFELRVRLAGGSAPRTTDPDHTMNIASYYDVTGDGVIDYEVFANLAARGWGSSWFDNRGRRAYVNEKSGVRIEVAGDEVVLHFSLSHLGGAERFQWALASEWGRYEVLSTPASARDDAPDNDAAVRFPG